METLQEGHISEDFAALRRQRDLYLRLLRLGDENTLELLLRESLALIVDVTGARQGYLELHGAPGEPARWSIACGLSEGEIGRVRAAISRGALGQALATGRTVTTTAARAPRLRDGDGVRVLRTAVLCTPIGATHPIGTLYLHGAQQRQHFTDEDRVTAEVFARHLAVLADRLVRRARVADDGSRAVGARLHPDTVVGRSAALAAVLQQVRFVAPLDVTVLLTGECGTGKSLLARVIHDHSRRTGGPFVTLDGATASETAVESAVAAAVRGTLFVDQVTDLSLAAQRRLLSLLGGDFRILAATSTDLRTALAAGRMRDDLCHRLAMLPLRVPSLAERREDVGDLAARFARAACERHGLPTLTLSADAVRAAEAAEWPGHVRQLAHAVESAAIRAAGLGAEQIEPAHLFVTTPASEGGLPTFQAATRDFQSRYIRQVLEATGWNVSEAARRLDLTRSYVYSLIRAFGLGGRRR